MPVAKAPQKLPVPDATASEFITVMAHQLRTPLSAVKWVMNMLLAGDVGELTPEQKSLLLKGYQSNERMISLVNDMLNGALIEAGRLRFPIAPRSLEDLVNEVMLDFFGPIQRKKIRFALNVAPPTLPRVSLDADRMKTVLHSLLENAVQYTPVNGSITLALEKDGKQVSVTIQDSGIGIPKPQQKKIFSRFFRGDNAVRMETDGSGLGLYVVRRIIEQHGGRVWFESEEGKGSAFHFTLPVA